MDNIAANPHVTLKLTIGPFMYPVFNCATSNFENFMLCAVVKHAFKHDVATAAFHGKGRVVPSLPIMDDSLLYDQQLSQIQKYDPARAKVFLKAWVSKD